MTSPFQAIAQRYWAKGLPVIPLAFKDKNPIIEVWQQYQSKMPSPELQATWLSQYTSANVGLPLGPQSNIVVIDVDTDDQAIHAALAKVLPQSPWVRIGQKGYCAAYRYNGVRSFSIKNSEGQGIIDFLSTGRQVVLPPSIHPKTDRPYVATSDLTDVCDDLPIISDQIEVILREILKDLGISLSSKGWTKITDYVATGARDNQMIRVAGMLSYAIFKGELKLIEAINHLSAWYDAQVEKVAGDNIDINKGISRLVNYIINDVKEHNKVLPKEWDAGLTPADKEAYGLGVLSEESEEWSYSRLISHLSDVTAPFPSDASERIEHVEWALRRIARSPAMSGLAEEATLKGIVSARIANVNVGALRTRLRELKQGNLKGTDHNEIADALYKELSKTGEVRFHQGTLWQYGGSHWLKVQDSEVLSKIASLYGNLPAAKRSNDHKGIQQVMYHKISQPLKMRATPGINFANGYLTASGELLKHDEDFGCTYTLPYLYEKDAHNKCHQWLDFLNSRWAADSDKEEKIAALQEAMCATLMGMAPKLQKAILLYGVAQSGKSQVLQVLRGCLPDEALSNISPSDWADKFMPVQMVGKILNIAGELSEKRRIPGDKFKMIVEGSTTPAQYKGKDVFNFEPIAAHWFAANFLPLSYDTSEGFNRRWLILTFNSRVADTSVQLDFGNQLVADEREAIVAWAIQAMPRIVTRQRYTIPASHTKAMEAMAEANDSVRFFIARGAKVKIVSPEVWGVNGKSLTPISLTSIFNEYWVFSKEAGDARPVGLKDFKTRMEELSRLMGFQSETVPDANGLEITQYKYITLVNQGKMSL